MPCYTTTGISRAHAYVHASEKSRCMRRHLQSDLPPQKPSPIESPSTKATRTTDTTVETDNLQPVTLELRTAAFQQLTSSRSLTTTRDCWCRPPRGDTTLSISSVNVEMRHSQPNGTVPRLCCKTTPPDHLDGEGQGLCYILVPSRSPTTRFAEAAGGYLAPWSIKQSVLRSPPTHQVLRRLPRGECRS